MEFTETVAARCAGPRRSNTICGAGNEVSGRACRPCSLDVVRRGIRFMDTDRRVVYCNRARTKSGG